MVRPAVTGLAARARARLDRRPGWITAPTEVDAGPGRFTLDVDADELAACIGCGLCLPHCPTYRVTREESASPRGRIALMRLVDAGAPPDDAFVGFMDACVQCRGCEPACPSGVPFGRLMEGTRASLAAQRPGLVPWWQRVAYRALGHHRLVLAGSSALAVAQRLRLVPARLGLPRLSLRRPRLQATGDDVWLHTGCVMDAWMRHVHVAAADLVGATGAGVALPSPGAACCGALHVHAGLTDEARALAEATMAAFCGDAPILVDSAGCGAQLKDYGHLLGTPEAAAFSARVLDIHEWLAPRIDHLPLRTPSPLLRVAVQDPCHLRHVQRAHGPVRTSLSRVVEVIELDDEGLCCGAGGAYAATHPQMAADIRRRKIDAIERSGAELVASANPGCLGHLAAAGVQVVHPVELLAAALDGPALESPALDGPALDSPALDSPALDSPALDSPALDGPALDGPALDGPALDGPALERPALDTSAPGDEVATALEGRSEGAGR